MAQKRGVDLIQSDQDSEWLESSKASWSLRAEAWNEMSGTNALTADRQRELDRWVEALHLNPGSRLLDAGCGSGQFSVAFAQRGCQVTGIDLSPAMLEHARGNTLRAGVSVEFMNGPLAPLAFPESAYDAIFCRTVLHIVPDPFAALREFRRVLRPGGRLYASVPGALSPIRATSWRRFVESELRTINDLLPWELEALMIEGGWQVVDSWGDWSGQESGLQQTAADVARASEHPLIQQATATTWGFVAE